MFDVNMYNATKDSGAGPVILEEDYSPLSTRYFLYDRGSVDQPLTKGRAIGGLISLGLLLCLGAYFVIAV